MATQYDENIEAQVKYYSGLIDAISEVPLRMHLKGRLDLWKLKSYALLNASGRGTSSYSLDGKSFSMVQYNTLKHEQEELFDELQTYLGCVGTGSGTTFITFAGCE